MSLEEVTKAIRKKSKKQDRGAEEHSQSQSEKEGPETGENITNAMSESQE